MTLLRVFRLLRLVSLMVLVGLPAGAMAGCQKNAATGRTHFMTLSREDEAKIGREAAPGFTEEFGGRVDDAELQAYVTRVGLRLAKHTEDYFPDIEWEFTLLDSSVVNAFALPGGKVFLTRGLAARMTDEAQLAGVLGHEIGHVTAQHANRRISNQQLFGVGLAVGAVIVGTSSNDSEIRRVGEVALPAISVGGSLVILKFGRDEELQADSLGMRYMDRGGYDPRGQREVMEILGSLSGGSRDPEWLSTHPYPERRIDEIDVMLDDEYAGNTGKRYQRRFERDFLGQLDRLPAPRHGGETTASLSMIGYCACGEHGGE